MDRRAGLTRPNQARVWDYLLGGTEALPADREHARRLADPGTGYPGIRRLALDNRLFLAKAVTWAAGRGISQVIDLGCGLLLAGRTVTRPDGSRVVLRDLHETARETAGAAAACVYVDADPMVASHASALLGGSRMLAAVHGDLRFPAAVCDDPAVRQVIGFSRPAVVVLGLVLDLSDAHDAGRIVAGYAARLAPGSAVVITVARYEDPAAARIAGLSPGRVNHSAEDVQGWFARAGLDLVRPAVADVRSWPVMPPGGKGRAAVIGGIGVKQLTGGHRDGLAARPCPHLTGPRVGAGDLHGHRPAVPQGP